LIRGLELGCPDIGPHGLVGMQHGHEFDVSRSATAKLGGADPVVAPRDLVTKERDGRRVLIRNTLLVGVAGYQRSRCRGGSGGGGEKGDQSQGED